MTYSEAESLKHENAGIYFDWGPDSKRYHSHIEAKPAKSKDGIDLLLEETLLMR
jgi:hypothetical protein